MFRKQLIVMGVISGILLGILGTVTLIGMSLPEKHNVKTEDLLSSKRMQVWQLMTTWEGQTVWNSSITKVEPLNDKGTKWRETYSSGDTMEYEILEWAPPSRVVRKIASEDAPFQGQWDIMLEPAQNPSMTKITIIENGSIANPFLRFVAHKIMGLETFHTSYIETLKFGLGNLDNGSNHSTN